jgi:hypothetical protein
MYDLSCPGPHISKTLDDSLISSFST